MRVQPIILCLALIWGMVCRGVWADEPGAQRSNIIVILADDLGYNDLGCYGAKDIATPAIDQMARDGVKLTSFYVSPVCSPTRASLMTGCHAQRVGIGGVMFPRNTHGLNPSERTLPELLKEKGYATALIGKWHLGNQDKFVPMKHGFDYWYGTPASNSQFFHPALKTFAKGCVFREGLSRAEIQKSETAKCPLIRNNEVIEVPANQTLFTKRYTDETIKFIAKNREQPFFIYLAHNMPHIPLHASKPFIGKSKRGLYGDVIQELDWSVGEIFQALKQHKLDRNTLVVFTSDNGPKIEFGGSAKPLRGAKGSSYEGGVRVPCIVRWPGRVRANHVSDEPTAIMDILPTLAKLAGATLPSDRVIDGKNIWPVMAGADGAKSPHEAIYYWKGRSAKGVRIGDWKYIAGESKKSDKPTIELSRAEKKLPREQRKALIKKRSKERSKQRSKEAAGRQSKKPPAVELYNLRQDIGEQHNLIEKHPDIAARLKAKLEAHQADMKKNQRPAGTADTNKQ